MSESAVILEGEVARRFNPVDKLRATNQDSSVSDWVPSDTLDLGSLMASENNLYLANIDDDCDAYEEVEVDVSTDLEDADDETKNTHKITGKGQDGNDYAVSVDGDGNLTTEMVPAAIHIVVPPRKRKYADGETLDFIGIHVYLMDGNNKRYTDANYPTGEIPFSELMFPVKIAEGSSKTEGYSEYTKDGVTALGITCATYGWMYNTYGYYYGAYIFGDVKIGASNSEIVFLTQYNGSYYGTTSEGYIPRFFTDKGWQTTGLSNGSNHFVKIDGFYNQYYSQMSIPTSSVDPSTVDFEDAEIMADVKIPVQWTRSDGELLEDTFEIEIGESEEGEDQPDPWGGYADVTYNGHFYNINRSIVPPVHYANGYCWQEGTTEYTVEQAISMGWLILIR